MGLGILLFTEMGNIRNGSGLRDDSGLGCDELGRQ